MAHQLQFVTVADINAVFECSVCGQRIEFNTPGIGEPAAIEAYGSYAPPENPDQWMSPCIE